MPPALSHPGVNVEGIPGGVGAITGVATAITAFVGRAARGPTDEAVVINNFGDFERAFGGLWRSSSLGFAVRDFFLNGGGQAIVVRLYHADEGDPNAQPAVPAKAAKVAITVGNLNLQASSPGSWGVALRVSVDIEGQSDEVAKSLGVQKADLYNLTVRDTGVGGRTERFLNLTVKPSARVIDKALDAESELVRYNGTPPVAATIAQADDALTTAESAMAVAQAALTDKQNADAGADVTVLKKAVTDARAVLDKMLADALAAVSDGRWLSVPDFLPAQGKDQKKGLYALEQADLFNLLCIPPYHAPTDALDVDVNLVSAAAAYCEERRAMLLVDAPKNWTTKDTARKDFTDATDDKVGTRSRNAALYFPRLRQPNPLQGGQIETFAASGAVAGVMARTDASGGVWKAPAGRDATLVGTPSLSVCLTDAENSELSPLGVNCLRSFPAAGRVVWGTRTLRGSDSLADEYKYIPVRRTALFVEESLCRGLKWVVFEPNDEALWAQIRLNVGAFMHNLFGQGAFQGTSPPDAYLVRCDEATTNQTDIDTGVVNIIVGFAPLKPAEFVVIKIQQLAGQIEV